MYYSYNCPACGKTFYSFGDHPYDAAQKLYNGIEKHMDDYKEHGKDLTLEHPNTFKNDINIVYHGMSSSETKPSGGWEL